MKSPALAAILNIIPGLGYLYLGTRRVFALILLVSAIFVGLDYFSDPNAEAYYDIPVTAWYYLYMVTAAAAFIVDAFLEGRKLRQAFLVKHNIKI